MGTFNFTAQVIDATGTAAGTTTADCAITNTAPVIRYTWRDLPSPPPPTGACANAAATVPRTTYRVYTTPGVTVVYSPGAPFAPTVVVNQMPGVVIRESRQDSRSPGQPPYFIALMDTSVHLADSYWVAGDTPYYVTPDHETGQTSLNSLDHPLSHRLNCEKNLSFYLPAESHPATTGWRRLAPKISQ